MRVVTVSRKPLAETVLASNVVAYGCGAINIDGCRVATTPAERDAMLKMSEGFAGRKWGRPDLVNYGYEGSMPTKTVSTPHERGRWPTNVVLDGVEAALDLGRQSGAGQSAVRRGEGEHLDSSRESWRFRRATGGFVDSGTAARFFKRIGR